MPLLLTQHWRCAAPVWGCLDLHNMLGPCQRPGLRVWGRRESLALPSTICQWSECLHVLVLA